MIIRFWTFFCLFLFTSQLVLSQSTNENTPGFYSSVCAGFGPIYGGLGGNLEAGYGHFSGYGSLGYATRKTYDTITIAPTVNYLFGLRYYFDVKSDVLFPRIGIGYGWVTNYYNDKIGNAAYDQTVHGMNLQVGAQFYTAEGLVFNIDISMSSKELITKPQTHPYFYDFYIRPNIGIGYDFSGLFGKNKNTRQIKNKEINPLG